ncbi:MAG TPA: histone deacetylase family protein [Gammaproteobacteria bacterium]|nr:histone deacetylase family protein [Gammaproteobacteria bacterium]
MFRIRQLHDIHAAADQTALSAVLRIYEEAFPYYPNYSQQIVRLLQLSNEQKFDTVLLVAEGGKARILGFSLSFYFPTLKLAYLDYLASAPKRSSRGYGTALYERNRELLQQAGCLGLFMDVPPDEAEKIKDKSLLPINKKRMAFYEHLGARPIVGTCYDQVSHAANQGYPTMLVYDAFKSNTNLRAAKLRKFITQLLKVKGNMSADDPRLIQILDSIRIDPVTLRAPRYPVAEAPIQVDSSAPILSMVTTGDLHQIHHFKEKGYVERPVRVQAILKGLESVPTREHPIKNFPERHILAVHQTSLHRFLKRAEQELDPAALIYPNVFPIRHPERIPKNWEMQAGYYCIDTFTPVSANAYRAARIAVNAALTGAELVQQDRAACYVLCRPPGHHAESRVFGGFCYFNNAAIAAHFLSQSGKVAFIDIDYHHGNGSQEIFYSRSDVYFVSIHGHPKVSYPYFAGYADERGEGEGKGFNRNFPLYPGVDDKAYGEVLDKAVAILKRFKPSYLVISLGFDIMFGDPTGAFSVTERGVEQIGRQLASLNVPTLVVQEGGYSLKNLRVGSRAFFRGFLQRDLGGANGKNIG